MVGSLRGGEHGELAERREIALIGRIEGHAVSLPKGATDRSGRPGSYASPPGGSPPVKSAPGPGSS